MESRIHVFVEHGTAVGTFHGEASLFLLAALAIGPAADLQTGATGTAHSTEGFVVLIVPHGGFNTPFMADTYSWGTKGFLLSFRDNFGPSQVFRMFRSFRPFPPCNGFQQLSRAFLPPAGRFRSRRLVHPDAWHDLHLAHGSWRC